MYYLLHLIFDVVFVLYNMKMRVNKIIVLNKITCMLRGQILFFIDLFTGHVRYLIYVWHQNSNIC
jgi:hypothetical protein